MDDNEASASRESNRDDLHDIYHTAFLLRQKLVPDVVPAILHHADLFERHVYSTGRIQPELTITQHSSPSTCLLTPPLQSSARAHNPVRKVVFQIESCDQGWASNKNAGSWTWFTAGIIRKQSPGIELADQDELRDVIFVDPERELFYNEVASSTIRTHVVEWTVDSDDENERQWVSALENGDRIAIRAWAQYSGWTNKIRAVSVTIYTTAVV